MEQSYTIYRHINIHNGKSYIGLTKRCPSVRWREHIMAAKCKSYTSYKSSFQDAIRKYGESLFYMQILESGLSKEKAKKSEIKYIEYYGTQGNAGYNMTSGGDDCGQKTIETILYNVIENKYYRFNSRIEAADFLMMDSRNFSNLVKGCYLTNKDYVYGGTVEDCIIRSQSGRLSYIVDIKTNKIYGCINDWAKENNISRSSARRVLAKCERIKYLSESKQKKVENKYFMYTRRGKFKHAITKTELNKAIQSYYLIHPL